MKFKIILFLFIVINIIPSFSQWKQANSGLEGLFNPFLRVYKILGLNGNLFAIYSGPATLLSSDNYGESWSIRDMHNGNFYPNWCSNCFKHVGDTIYIGNRSPTPSNIIYRSWDGFNTWEVINFPFYIDITAMTLKKNNIYIGAKEYGWIAKSPDLGETWYVKEDKLNPYNISADIIDIHVFGSRIFVSLNNKYHPEYNGAYYSDDEMESFTRAEINSENRNSMKFTDYQGILYAMADDESFMSSDSGMTWQSMTYSFGQFTALRLKMAFKDSIYLVNGILGARIIISTDNGQTWRKKDEGLEFPVNCLTIYGDYAFAGTGNGIYRARLDELTDVDDYNPNALSSEVIPNPFSEKTQIKFSLENPCRVKLTVYNALGYKVAVLVDKYLDSGGQTTVFDGSSFPSGAYFYVLQAGESVESGKMIIIK